MVAARRRFVPFDTLTETSHDRPPSARSAGLPLNLTVCTYRRDFDDRQYYAYVIRRAAALRFATTV